MHLITRCKKGDFTAEELSMLPRLEAALPGHLEAILQENSETLLSSAFMREMSTGSAGASGSSNAEQQGQVSGSAVPGPEESSPSSPNSSLQSLQARSPECSYATAGAPAGAQQPPPSAAGEQFSALRAWGASSSGTADQGGVPAEQVMELVYRCFEFVENQSVQRSDIGATSE